MPILSYVLERMGYTTSCVGINLGDIPRGSAPWDVHSVDPSTLGRISPYVTRLPQVLLHFMGLVKVCQKCTIFVPRWRKRHFARKKR